MVFVFLIICLVCIVDKSLINNPVLLLFELQEYVIHALSIGNPLLTGLLGRKAIMGGLQLLLASERLE